MIPDPVLILEASTDMASVAVVLGGRVVAAEQVASRDVRTGARTEGLVPAILRALTHAGLSVSSVSAILCSAGPGGFTSLRSAAAVAKGMCSALRIPLYAVPTMMPLAVAVASRPGMYVAALDAGRGEWYASLIRVADAETAEDVLEVGPVQIVSREALERLALTADATLVGPGQTIDVYPQAQAVADVLSRILATEPVNLASWEPAYGRAAEAQVKWEAAHGRPFVLAR